MSSVNAGGDVVGLGPGYRCSCVDRIDEPHAAILKDDYASVVTNLIDPVIETSQALAVAAEASSPKQVSTVSNARMKHLR